MTDSVARKLFLLVYDCVDSEGDIEPGVKIEIMQSIAETLTKLRQDTLEEAANEAIRKVSELTVNELVPFEQYEPFKRLAQLIALSIRSLK